jgi:hypothetical protein
MLLNAPAVEERVRAAAVVRGCTGSGACGAAATAGALRACACALCACLRLGPASLLLVLHAVGSGGGGSVHTTVVHGGH